MTKRPNPSLLVLALAATVGLPALVNAQQTASPPPVQRAVEPATAPRAPAQAQDQPENALSSDRAAPAAAEPEGKGWLPPGGSVQVKTSDQGIRYASGGVGESEREELRAMSDQFNVRVMSAMQSGGEYLADVQVKILNSHGATILSAISKGPYFLAQLPAGSYTVEATAQDQSQKKSAQVGKGQAQVNFYWR
ncbi:MAG: carboxypeptidase-like regulatory domain-containing protein [Candidatus Competibacter sp.]